MKTDQKQELIDLLKKFPSIQCVCAKLGIARSTYYRWIHEDNEFAKNALESLRDGVFEFNGLAESHLLGQIESGNLSAIYFWLKKKHEGYMALNRLQGIQKEGNESEREAVKTTTK